MSLLIWCWNLNRFWKYQTKWGCQRWQRELVSKESLWGRNFCKEPQGFGSGLKAAESPFFHETLTSGHWCQQRLLPPVVTGCFLSSHTPPPPPGSRCLLPMPYPLKEAVYLVLKVLQSDRTGFKSWLWFLLAVWLPPICLTSLGLHCLFVKMGMIIVTIS